MPPAAQGELRFFQDQVGTLVAILDENENNLTTLEHDSFGNRLGESNHRITPYLGFCSGLHDRDTNLVLFGYRNYDPDIGRFITPDPLGYTGGDPGDMYEYCVDDPIHASDRTGLWGDSLFGGKKKEGSDSGGWWKGNVKKAEEKRWLGNVGNAVANVAASAAKAAGPGQWLRGVGGAVKSATDYASPTQWLRGIGSVVEAAGAADITNRAAKAARAGKWLRTGVDGATGIARAMTSINNDRKSSDNGRDKAATFSNLHTSVGLNAGWGEGTLVRAHPWHEDSEETRKRRKLERGLKLAQSAKSDSRARNQGLCLTMAASAESFKKGIEQMENQYKLADWANEESKESTEWLDKLPRCPCDFPGDVQGEWMVSNDFIDKYHPGATNCIRSIDPNWEPGDPGQQCCYDEKGKLITGGRGAGTPDKVAPNGVSVFAHRRKDVYASDYAMDCVDSNGYLQYNRYRPPNNACGCPENIR